MTTKAMSKEAPSTKLASTRETPKLKLQGYCRAVGSLSSSFARFTRKISWPKAGAAGISELTGWPIVPSYSALYRFAGVMEFHLRNGLREKTLNMKALKNSPPASASARVFPEELFFASGQRSVVSCRLKLQNNIGMRNLADNWGALVRLCPRKSAKVRLCPPFAGEVFLCGARNPAMTTV